MLIQVIFILYSYKIGLNQDLFECYVDLDRKKDKYYPCAYSEDDDMIFYDKAKQLERYCPNAVNVTRNYNIIFRDNFILYTLFDIYILFISVWYYRTTIRKVVYFNQTFLYWLSLFLVATITILGASQL